MDFDQIVERNRIAIDAFAKGGHLPLAELWSRDDDISLGNPFGPFVRGFDDVVATMERADELSPVALRCTSVFRREGDGWRLVHRHADPITTLRGPESVIGS